VRACGYSLPIQERNTESEYVVNAALKRRRCPCVCVRGTVGLFVCLPATRPVATLAPQDETKSTRVARSSCRVSFSRDTQTELPVVKKHKRFEHFKTAVVLAGQDYNAFSQRNASADHRNHFTTRTTVGDERKRSSRVLTRMRCHATVHLLTLDINLI